MKTIFSILVLLALVSNSVFSSGYEDVMLATIGKVQLAKSPAEFTDLANQFKQISEVEKGQWLPGYYAAYCYVSLNWLGEISKDDQHKNLDLAQAEIDKLLKITSGESEVYALQSLIFQMRITDLTKGYKYTGLSFEALGKAENLDPTNPRVHYLRGTNLFHMPKMFGGGAEKAKPLFEKAAQLFASEQPVSKLHPVWGGPHNNELLAQCLAGKE